MQSALQPVVPWVLQSLAILALLDAAAPAYAQSTPDDFAVVAECPALHGTGGGEAPDCSAKQNKPDSISTTGTLKSDSLASPREFAAAPSAAAASSTILASDLLGRTVFSRDGKAFGEIQDVVLTYDLDAVVAVIGFGGFLGLGGKSIAIPAGKINLAKEDNGGIKLSVAATWEQLRAAPSFYSTALMR